MTVGRNVHATAIVLGTHGFLIVGTSGSGKTSLGMTLVASALQSGTHATFVADDQVFVSDRSGRVLAERPESIKGLVELRGASIVGIGSVAAAIIDFALMPVAAPFEPRLPPEAEAFALPSGTRLPLYRIPLGDRVNPLEILRLMLPASAGFQG